METHESSTYQNSRRILSLNTEDKWIKIAKSAKSIFLAPKWQYSNIITKFYIVIVYPPTWRDLNLLPYDLRCTSSKHKQISSNSKETCSMDKRLLTHL